MLNIIITALSIVAAIDGYIARLEARKEELKYIMSTSTIEREIVWATEERENWTKLLS